MTPAHPVVRAERNKVANMFKDHAHALRMAPKVEAAGKVLKARSVEVPAKKD